MSKFDQAKMLMKVRKLQKELQHQIIVAEAGDGAVKVEINGEQKIKKIHIDPETSRFRRYWPARKMGRRSCKRCYSAEPKTCRRKNAAYDGCFGLLLGL